MRQSLTLTFALWRLRLKLHRYNGFWLIAYGLLLPGSLSLWAQSHASDAAASRHVVVGTFVLGLFTLVASRAGQTVASERMAGVWALLSTTRVTRNIYLAVQALDMLALIAVPMLGLVIAQGMYGNAMPRSALWILPTVLASATFGAIGLLIAGAVPRRLAVLVMKALVVSTLAFCPMLYTFDRVPAGLRQIVHNVPPTLALSSLLSAWNGDLYWPDAARLAIWCAVTCSCVLKFFPWSDTGTARPGVFELDARAHRARWRTYSGFAFWRGR